MLFPSHRTKGCPSSPQISGSTVGKIRVVQSMHERKALMFEEADAFITIPGGERAARCRASLLHSPGTRSWPCGSRQRCLREAKRLPQLRRCPVPLTAGLG